MPKFIPGLQLNEAFYWKAVRPILDAHFPNLPHAAALVNSGSEVLGFDTPVSRDHDWGPQLNLFLRPESFDETRQAIDAALRNNLPARFMGYSTNYSRPDLADGGTRMQEEIDRGPIEHKISFHTVAGFWQGHLGVDPFRDPDAADWLTFSEQELLLLTSGKVFHDGLGLEAVRQRFAYYPRDVWLFLLACQWDLISQIEAFVGRTWSTGDELGSRILTARMAEFLMRLCFLMEKRYAPYSKWFGAGFQRLACYSQMGPLLEGAVAANAYPEREQFLARAYTLAAEMHNALAITPRLDTRTRTYTAWHALRSGTPDLAPGDPRDTRPFQCIFAGRFCEAIYEAVQDKELLSFLPALGGANQFLVESSQALQSTAFRRSLKEILTRHIQLL